MRLGSRLAYIVGLLILSACGGSGGDGGVAPADSAGREASALVCGGVAGTACPQGYRCTDDPADSCDPASRADCAGICVLGADLPSCGGPAGTVCAAGSVCVEDPNATCTGGPSADCAGICRLKADGQCSTDADCPVLEVRCSICADGSVSCPNSRCDQGTCTVDFKPCVDAQGCGGIAGVSCPPGSICVDDPTDACVPEKGGADCPGVCQPDVKPPTCGGIAGLACPSGFECIDDPTDTCDPKAGGVDCPGKCAPAAGGECTTDADCPALRASCSVCADGTAACPASFCDAGRCIVSYPTCPAPVICTSACQPGEVCVPDPNTKCDPATGMSCTGVCVPDGKPRPCGGLAGATCPQGYECVDDPSDNCSPGSGGADCPGMCAPIPPGQCTADSDCVGVLAPCTQCADGSYSCPRPQCRDGMCTIAFDACTGPGFCGGIAGFPCAPGFTCIDNPKDNCDPKQGGADCAGICVREDEPQRCGGLTGEPCPAGYECVDDSRDACDPVAGGADCPGICRPSPSPGCTSDADCPVIGAPCRLCADGSAACARSFCDAGKCAADFKSCAGEL